MENENNGAEVLTLREVARILKCRTNQIYELSRRREVGRVCIQTGQRSMGMAEGSWEVGAGNIGWTVIAM